MKYYQSFNGRTVTNGYVRLDIIHDIDSLTYLDDCRLVSQNFDTSLKQFLLTLSKYEEKHSRAVREGFSSRLGVAYRFLLDRKRSLSELKELVNEIHLKIDAELPFWAYYTERNKAAILIIYFSDRYYYPNGFVKNTYIKNDTYKDSKTGKICKADNPNAIIFHHKGELLQSENVEFSSKVKHFRFSSFSAFYKHIESLKVWYVKKVDELFKFSVEEGFVIPRISYQGLTPLQRNNAEHWNKVFKDVEDIFDEQIWRLKFIDFWDDKTRQCFDILFYKIRSIVKDGRFYYGTKKRLKGYISIHTRSPKTLNIYLDGFKDRCNEELHKTIFTIEQH